MATSFKTFCYKFMRQERSGFVNDVTLTRMSNPQSERQQGLPRILNNGNIAHSPAKPCAFLTTWHLSQPQLKIVEIRWQACPESTEMSPKEAEGS